MCSLRYGCLHDLFFHLLHGLLLVLLVILLIPLIIFICNPDHNHEYINTIYVIKIEKLFAYLFYIDFDITVARWAQVEDNPDLTSVGLH